MSYPDIPLVDLHRHLDCSVRLQTMLDLARQHGLELPASDVQGLRPRRRITLENLEDAVREGIDYIELRFSPQFMGELGGLDPMGVTSTVCEAWQEARSRLPVMAKLIVILSRHYGPEACQVELEAAIAHRERGVVAIDIAGVEDMGPGHLFVDHCRQAREAGLHLTIHAGEWSGAASVRQAVLELGAERIGHAIGAKDDPATMDLLADRRTAIETCPTSNVQFSMVPGFKDHPLLMWLDRGLLVTVNTDNTSICGIDLPHEYRVVREEMGLSDAQIRKLQENGVKAAFLTEEERAALWAAKTESGA